MERQMKIPGSDHPITIEQAPARVRVLVGGEVIAESTTALVLKEASYPAVYYLPRADIDQSKLVRSETESYCPYKGDCSYFSVSGGRGRVQDAAWSYEHPFEAVHEITEHLAFYPDRAEVFVDERTESPA